MGLFFRTYAAMTICAVAATMAISYPQALAMDAPDRGILATALTLTAFFAAIVALVFLVSTLLALAFRWLVGRLSGSRPSPTALFAGGAISAAAVLALTPIGEAPQEIAGFVGAWITAGGVGAVAVEDRPNPGTRIRWRRLLIGSAAACVVGLVTLALGGS
jgi:hypothetical protein